MQKTFSSEIDAKKFIKKMKKEYNNAKSSSNFGNFILWEFKDKCTPKTYIVTWEED